MARRLWCLCCGWCAWAGSAVVLAGWQWRCHGGGGVAMVAGLWRRLLCCVGAVNMRAQTGPTQTDWLISMQFTVLARNRRHWGRRKGNRAGSCLRGYAPAPWCMHSVKTDLGAARRRGPCGNACVPQAWRPHHRPDTRCNMPCGRAHNGFLVAGQPSRYRIRKTNSLQAGLDIGGPLAASRCRPRRRRRSGPAPSRCVQAAVVLQ
jgi:hypothetical protein